MKTTVLDLKVDQPFDFHSLLVSHGWVDLLPNIYQRESETFSRIEELHSGKIVRLDITEADHTVKAAIQHTSKLTSADLKDVEQSVRHMLRLDEDFSEFYKICSHSGKPWSEMASGKGRLLRSAGLFEDMVKVILTTNVQWGGTRRMVAEIVNAFGKPLPQQPELKAFPRPEAIATNSFEGFQSQVRLGYRAPYIFKLAQDFCETPAAFDAYWDVGRSTEEVRKSLLGIKGIGNYAAASVLMLLGRYDEIPVDSVFQQMMSAKYFKDDHYDVKKALAVYADWGKWKYLAYWFDLIDYYP